MFGGDKATYFKLWKHWVEYGNVDIPYEKRGRPESVVWEIEEAEGSESVPCELLATFAFEKTIENPTGFTRAELHTYLNKNGYRLMNMC